MADKTAAREMQQASRKSIKVITFSAYESIDQAAADGFVKQRYNASISSKTGGLTFSIAMIPAAATSESVSVDLPAEPQVMNPIRTGGD